MSKLNFGQAVKNLLVQLAKLRNPVVIASAVAVIIQALPGVNIDGQVIAVILGGVGGVATFIEELIATKNPTPVQAATPVKEVKTVV